MGRVISTPGALKGDCVVCVHPAGLTNDSTPATRQDDGFNDFAEQMNAALGPLRAGIALNLESHGITPSFHDS